MTIGHYIANFFAAIFLCNSIPHLAKGLCGERFPTPFARPPGTGESSALINFLWGTFNLMAGLALIAWRPVFVGVNLNSGLFVLGFILIGLHLSIHFEKVRRR